MTSHTKPLRFPPIRTRENIPDHEEHGGATALCAIADPMLAESVAQCIAATGLPAIDGLNSPRLRTQWLIAQAVICDEQGWSEISQLALPPRQDIYLVFPSWNHDSPGDPPPWEAAGRIGASDVIGIPSQSITLVEKLGLLRRSVEGGGLVAVYSATGGAGTSTFSAGLASLMARRHTGGSEAILIDANVESGHDDFLLGIEDEPGARWGELTLHGWETRRAAALEGNSIADSVPTTSEGLRVVATGRTDPPLVEPTEYLDLAVDVALGVQRCGYSVVLDVPTLPNRGEDRIDWGCFNAVVLIVPLTFRGLLGASRTSRLLIESGAQPLCVARKFEHSSMNPSHIEEHTGLPVVAHYRDEKSIARKCEHRGFELPERGSFRSALEETLDLIECTSPDMSHLRSRDEKVAS